MSDRASAPGSSTSLTANDSLAGRTVSRWWRLSPPYLVVAAAAAGILVSAPSDPVRWPSLALLCVFALLLRQTDAGPLAGRRATLYLGAQTAVLLALYVLYPGTFAAPLLTFVTSAQAVLFTPRRQAMIWIGVWVTMTTVSQIDAQGVANGLAAAALYGAGYFFFVAFARVTQQAERARREAQRLLNELQVAHRQLQDYADRVEALAAAEERNRLARELHDTLGHRLTVSSVQLEAAQRLIGSDPARAETMISTTRDEVRAALADLRRTVAALRAPLDENIENMGQALGQLVKNFQQATDTPVSLTLPAQIPALPDNCRMSIYRSVQEGLTNIQKHAQASHVWITLSLDEAEILVSIEDDGKGFLPTQQPGGYGLRGLQERVTALQGTLAVDSRPGAGTRLTLCLPRRLLQEDYRG